MNSRQNTYETFLFKQFLSVKIFTHVMNVEALFIKN